MISIRSQALEVVADVVRKYQVAWGQRWTPEMLVENFAQGWMGFGGNHCWEWRPGKVTVTMVEYVPCNEVFTLEEVVNHVKTPAQQLAFM